MPEPTGNQGGSAVVWKVVAAFLAGAFVSAASLVQIVPDDTPVAAGDRQVVEEYVTDDPDALADGEGGFVEEEEEVVEEGEDGERRVVRRRRVAGEGSSSSSGATGGSRQRAAGTGGTADTSTGSSGGSGGSGDAGGSGATTGEGVEANRIRLASTVVLDGPAASLLRPSVTAMRAVLDKVNQNGGIHGRILELDTRNDGFDAQRGHTFIRSFIEEEYFAFPVVPSAEGLGSAILAGDISRAGIPVVGTDGMRQEQYHESWVWPVAAATVSTMRAMARYAYDDQGARSFAIVYDDKYKFGIEGKDAFVEQVERMGGEVVHTQPLDPDAPGYSSEAQQFNSACSDDACDMVALLLLPDAAQKWIDQDPAFGGEYTAGAQTLFTRKFAEDCVRAVGSRCHGLAVWTGYNPPVGEKRQDPDVSAYVDDMEDADPNIDVENQFVQGAYLGMQVFTEALEQTGPDLTRERLQQTLDGMDYDSGLSSTLQWRDGDHWANVHAQSFTMRVSGGRFTGWGSESDWVRDPER